jgi:hypothetical protein
MKGKDRDEDQEFEHMMCIARFFPSLFRFPSRAVGRIPHDRKWKKTEGEVCSNKLLIFLRVAWTQRI